jgi:hypothetical protein
MFHFFKEFTVTTAVNVPGSKADDEKMQWVVDKFYEIAKHFYIGYNEAKRSFVEYPTKARNRGNIVAFGHGAIVLSWKCIMSPERYEEFKAQVNDYVKENGPFPNFDVYEAPRR